MGLWKESYEGLSKATGEGVIAWRGGASSSIDDEAGQDSESQQKWYVKQRKPRGLFDAEYSSKSKPRKSGIIDAGHGISVLAHRGSISLPVLDARPTK
jgi:hypothetical protein